MLEQDNSLKQSLQEVVNIQREQLLELRQMRHQTMTQNNSTDVFGVPRNVKFSPYTVYSLEAGQPMPFSASTVQMFDQAKFYRQQASGVHRFLASTSPTRINPQVADMARMQHINQLTNAGVAFAGGVAGVAGDLAGGALFAGAGGGLIGSMVAGLGAGAAAGWFFDNGLDQMKQHQRINDFLFQNSYRFINRFESNNRRYRMGFSMEERHEVSDFIRHLNTEKFLKDEEVQQMMMDFTNYDLLRTVSDVKSFKEHMSKLVDATKTAAITLNESYSEITKLMGEFKKMGIEGTDFTWYSSGAKVVAGYTGQDASQLMKVLAQIAQQLTSGTDAESGQVLQDVQLMQKLLGELRHNAETNTDPSKKAYYNRMLSYINNRGGVEQVTQEMANIMYSAMTSNDLMGNLGAALYKRDENGILVLDESVMEDMRRGRVASLDQLANIAETKMKKDKGFAVEWNNLQKRKSAVMSTDLADIAYAEKFILYKALEGKGYSRDDLDKVAPELLGIQLGEGQEEILKFTLENLTPDYEKGFVAETAIQEAIDRSRAKTPSAWDRVKAWWGGLEDAAGDPFAELNQTLEPIGLSFYEKLIGGEINYAKYLDYNITTSSKDFKNILDSINVYDGLTTYTGDEPIESIRGVLTPKGIKAKQARDLLKFTYEYGYGYGRYKETKTMDAREFYTDLSELLAGTADEDNLAKGVQYHQAEKDLNKKIEQTKDIIDNMHVTEKSRKKFYSFLNDRTVDTYLDALSVSSTDEDIEDAISRLEKASSGSGLTKEQQATIKSMIEKLQMRRKTGSMLTGFMQGKKAVVDIKGRMLKSGSEAVVAAELFSTFADKNNMELYGLDKLIKELQDSLEIRSKSANYQTFGTLIQWQDDFKNSLVNWMKKLDSSELNKFLNEAAGGNLEELTKINELEKGTWTEKELKVLADALMAFADKMIENKSPVEEDHKSNEVGKKLDQHKSEFDKLMDMLDDEITRMRETNNRASTYLDQNYFFGGP